MGDIQDVQCEIRSKSHPAGVEVLGIAWSSTSTSGSYNFIVNKEGPAGSTYVVQKSPFTLEADERQVLGAVSLTIDEGDRYIVRLTITIDGHETICSRLLT